MPSVRADVAHLFLPKTIYSKFGLSGLIIQKRESIIPTIPGFSTEKDKKNSNRKINLVLIKKIGKVSKPIITDFNKNKIRNFLNNLYK